MNGLPTAAAVLESERWVCEVDPLVKHFVNATPASLSEAEPVPRWGEFMSAFGEEVAHALSSLIICPGIQPKEDILSRQEPVRAEWRNIFLSAGGEHGLC